MENFIKEKTITYISKDKNIKGKELRIVTQKLDGMCNSNYLVTIKSKLTGEILSKIVFKKFGEISDCVDHSLETQIIQYLSNYNIGPKLYFEQEDYRMIEYIPDTTNISRENLFDNKILTQIYSIFNIYNLFTYTYKYKIDNNNNISIEPFIIKEKNDLYKKNFISKTLYENCVKKIFVKAKSSFDKFYKKFKENNTSSEDKIICNIVEKFNYYLDNFKELYNSFYPKEGFFVMCHNDVNRYNFILKKNGQEKKLFILDHEYASLNLPGYDMADYFNESNFHFYPKYNFSFEEIDFDKYFEEYTKYISVFIRNHNYLNNDEDGQKFLELIQTKNYYLSLHLIINYFWFLCCLVYLDYDKWKKGQNSFNIAKDLIKFLEFGLEKYNEFMNNKK